MNAPLSHEGCIIWKSIPLQVHLSNLAYLRISEWEHFLNAKYQIKNYFMNYNFEKFCFCDYFIFSISWVDNINYCIGSGVVTGPNGSDSLLST